MENKEIKFETLHSNKHRIHLFIGSINESIIFKNTRFREEME